MIDKLCLSIHDTRLDTSGLGLPLPAASSPSSGASIPSFDPALLLCASIDTLYLQVGTRCGAQFAIVNGSAIDRWQRARARLQWVTLAGLAKEGSLAIADNAQWLSKASLHTDIHISKVP